ncbi:MAG: hypothetical protein D6746_13145 [Bacteroidetes bacterium]|nr:MAG: hypothetical protein D6746_13145 [Bacteroidota bacterium]
MERVNDNGRAGREVALLKLREWAQEQVPVEGRPAIVLPFLTIRTREPGEGRSEIAVHPYLAEMMRRLWEQAAEDLNGGRYGDVLSLRRRLDEQATQAREEYYERRRAGDTLHFVLRVLRAHGDRHGAEATLAGSLGRRPPYTPERGYYWAVTDPVGEDEGPAYTLMIPPAEVQRERLRWIYPVLPLGECLAYGPLPGRLTWREALALPEAALKDVPTEKVASRRYWLRFRLSVLDAAIWEYETFGVVPPLTDEKVADLFKEDEKRALHREKLRSKDRDYVLQKLQEYTGRYDLSLNAALDRLIEEAEMEDGRLPGGFQSYGAVLDAFKRSSYKNMSTRARKRRGEL